MNDGIRRLLQSGDKANRKNKNTKSINYSSYSI